MPLFTLRPYDYRIFCPRCAKLHTTFCFAVFFHLPKPSHSHYTDWSHRHKTASATMKPHPLVLLFSALASKHVLRYRRQQRDEKRCSRPYSFRPNTLQNKRSEKKSRPSEHMEKPAFHQPTERRRRRLSFQSRIPRAIVYDLWICKRTILPTRLRDTM